MGGTGKRYLGSLLVALLALPKPTVALIVLRGEVVEPGCFVIGNRRGEAHRQCAIACARGGQDLAILDEKTRLLWLELPDRRAGAAEQQLLPHVAQRVEVRGTPYERGGMRGLRIETVRALP